MITSGANYRELIFLLLLICAHHFTDPGCELQINTQQLPVEIREYSVTFNYCYTTVDTETGKKGTSTYPAL